MKIVSLTPTVPWEGIAHAGGVYYLRHLRELAKLGDVTVIAPDTAENRAAHERGSEEPWTVRFAPIDGRLIGPARAPIRKAMNFWRLVTPHAEHRPGLLATADPLVREADVVEFQWPHYAGLTRPLRALLQGNHRPRFVVVPHDVLSQKTARERTAVSWLVRLRARTSGRRMAWIEARNNRAADIVLVFSENDAAVVATAGVPVRVVHPPLSSGVTPRPAGPAEDERARALFVGDFSRDVNIGAAEWLLREVWPEVLRTNPDAVLVLAGRCAEDLRQSFSTRAPNVVVTGYVEDLDPVYASATVAMAPLLAGAGLKFKVATAMLASLPVVATSVGAEGYPADQDLFVAVTDAPGEFAAAVAGVLTSPGEFTAGAQHAQAWAAERFSTDTFATELRAIYQDLAKPGSGTPH